MALPERRIKSEIKKVLDTHGPSVYTFMYVPSGYGRQTVDYLVCAYGVFLGIEAKAPGAGPTPRQEITLAQIRAAGGRTFVVNDKESLGHFEVFLRQLKELT